LIEYQEWHSGSLYRFRKGGCWDLTGTYRSCYAVAHVMLAQNSGSNVVMSSMAGKTSRSGKGAYSEAKIGGIGLGHADIEMIGAVDALLCTDNRRD
jgi:hypothetical protein